MLLDKKNQSSALAPSSTPALVKAVNQPPVYQAPIPQTQSVTQTYFESYIKANDAALRNMQSQGQNEQSQCQGLQTQIANLTDMLSKFVSSNTASSSGSGTLPSNTITNPKEDLKGMDECLALADLGACINLMPVSVWEGLSLLELTPTCMTHELADRSVSKPIGIAKDVSFKVGVFHFPSDFMVVDFEPDPRVPLILERCFLKTGRALIDVHNEVLGFSDVTISGNPTLYDDLIVSTTSPTLTPFGDSDFLLFEEADTFLGLEDDPNSPKINPFYYDPEGDILLLEAILNSKPLPPFPNHKQYMPSYKKELKVCEAKTVKSSVNEPPEVELKDLPPRLEYAFLEGDNKLPVIISKELGDEEKSALIKVLKSHKRAIAWKLSDIQGDDKLPVIIAKDLSVKEKTALITFPKSHKRAIAWKLSDIK
nr:hypothetical protein [Tanacetum cinerariifolium]